MERRAVNRRGVPWWVKPALIGGTFAALWWLEQRRPLRRPTQGKGRRDARNLTIALMSGASIQLAEAPLTSRATALVERRRIGLLKCIELPRWLEDVLAVLLLDYTLYLWHIATHAVPLLWRFHKPHHVDLDMDASTGLRFHFGEMMLSAPVRAAQVLLIGVSPRALSLWQTLTLLSVMFHHSNVRLPPRVEWWLSRVVVTPRMHGIHHSDRAQEIQSNWSSGLSWWDHLHGTFRLDVPQQTIRIGVAGYQRPRHVTLGKVLKMPLDEPTPHYLVRYAQRVVERLVRLWAHPVPHDESRVVAIIQFQEDAAGTKNRPARYGLTSPARASRASSRRRSGRPCRWS